MRAEWAYSGPDEDKFTVELWAREDGKAGQENKYEFPPPVDTMLFFGGCALVAKDMTVQHCVIPLTLQKWEKMYNFLFGGFDTLPNCDDPESDESDESDTGRKTKDGYLKDGFVIDNNEGFETDYEEDVSTLTDDDDVSDSVSDDSDDDDSDDDDSDDDSDDADNDNADSDDDNDNNDDNDDTDNVNDKLKQKCNHAKNKITPPSVTKKRNTRHQLREEVGPSFELVEETYEYSDD